jgi:phosphosulfolactate synthase (CoM biosynthesis protein A)
MKTFEQWARELGIEDHGWTWEISKGAWDMCLEHNLKDIEFQRDAYKAAAEEWMQKHDELRAKYEPEILTTARYKPLTSGRNI